MKYALNIADDARILSACIVLDVGNYDDMPIVEELPTGETEAEKNIYNWLYVDGEYVYDPLPEPDPVEPTPTNEDRITALENQLAAYEAAYQEGVNEA